MWIAELHDMDFVKKLKECLKTRTNKMGTHKRMEGMLQVVSEELPDVPLYYSVDTLARTVKCSTPPTVLLRSALLNAGYRQSYSHACKTSLKTDAPPEVVWDVFRAWCAKNAVDTDRLKDGVGKQIFSKKRDEQVAMISFKMAKEAEPPSKEMKLLRYQMNPAPFWGPKSRPRKDDKDKRAQNQGKRRKTKLSDNETNVSLSPETQEIVEPMECLQSTEM